MNSSIYLGSYNYIDTKFHSKLEENHLTNIMLILVGIGLLSLMAQLSIVLPIGPVPITAQSFAILIIGSLYGAKRAAITTLSYIALGAMGLPIFSGGSFGLVKLMGPTGGYLIGFVLAASTMGFLSEFKLDRSLKSALLIFTVGHFIIFLCGLIWLSFFVKVQSVLALGFYPFIPGMILKTILAASCNRLLWKFGKSEL